MDYRKIYELQQMTGQKDKEIFMRNNSDDEDFCKLLYYALNPMLSYRVSEKSLSDIIDVVQQKECEYYKDIFDCCEHLSRMKGMDFTTLSHVKEFLLQFDIEERMLYIKLLSKTLKLGVTAKTVNKIVDKLIPEWEVQQAFTIEKYPLREREEFWVTEKLNGVRATFYNGEFMARSGTVYTGLEHISSELEWLYHLGFVTDGELTLKNKEGLTDNEAFRIATGIINSDCVDKTAICYTIFDIIPLEEFENNYKITKYSERRGKLDELSDDLKTAHKAEYVSVLPVLYHGDDISKIDLLLDKMVAEDKEGLMINKNVPYKRTRHKGILKVKRFYTMDLEIIGCEEGSGRLAGTLGALILDYMGNEVRVGSGFTDEQREYYWNDKESLVGKICEVKYKEISNDKRTRKQSLQFPVFVGIREDKSEVSYG